MAAVTDKTYFPPLEECLTGKTAILSWKLVASALADTQPDRITSTAVSTFLKDPRVQQFLKSPYDAFEPPNPRSKADFDTKTAAINVSPTPNERYDINVIKTDAQWLSKSANINEVAALRVVVVEFQSRAQSHLTGPLSTQDITNIQEAAGVSDAQTSSILALLNVSSVADAETTWIEFEKETSRRQRLLATYLSERRSFLSFTDSLITFMMFSSSSHMGKEVDDLRHKLVMDTFEYDERQSQPPNVAAFEAIVPKYIALLRDCIERSQTGFENVASDILTEKLAVDWVRTALTEAVHAMTVVYQLIDLAGDNLFTTHEITSQWFKFVAMFEFLDPLNGAHDMIAELILPLRSLTCAISLKILNLTRALMYLDQDGELLDHEDPYLTSSDILSQIHAAVLDAANAGSLTAGPVILAWTLILLKMFGNYQERVERRDLLQNTRAQIGFEQEIRPSENALSQRRNSTGSIVSIEKSPYDVFLSANSLTNDGALIESLGQAATARGQVYELISEMSHCLGGGQFAAFQPLVGSRLRTVFLDLLLRSYPIVGYIGESVSALLAVLSGGRNYWDLSLANALGPTKELASIMLKNDELLSSYMNEALCRFPYEYEPFISLCRILSTSLRSEGGQADYIMNLLLKTPSITIPFDWQCYELTSEDDNTNSFQLFEDIDLFGSSMTSKRRPTGEERFTIPAGTEGRFVTESGYRVALLEYEHSALALLGKRLEANLLVGSYSTGLTSLRPDEVAEAISLMATVLRSEVLKASNNASRATSEAGINFLKEASRALPHNKDILTVVCDTLDTLIEEELASLDAGKIAALSACLQFLHATLAVCPGRVWAYMTRCGLINGETRAGRLSRITGNLEMLAERCGFLISAMKFFSSLIESAMTGTVQRKVGASGSVRSKGEENPWLGTSEKVLSRVSLSIAQTAVDVLENSATWRFPSELDRSVVVTDVIGIMHKLLSYTFSIGTPESPTGLTSCLVPAAQYIVESFTSTSVSSLRFQPLLATLLVAFQIPDSTLYPHRSRIVAERLIEALTFATTLLRVSDYLEQPSATIQTQFFKSASLVARLPAIRQSFVASSISLLSALVQSAGKGSAEPPSLLGYLGPQISRSFIQIASQLDQPYSRLPEMVSTWKFFSTIMRNRQQWMANCLLTGKTPREALKGNGKIAGLSPGSVLSTAIEKLRSIKTLPSQEAMAILDFFTSAQNYWPWTIFAMQKDTAFLSDLRAYVRELKAPSVTGKTNAREAGNQARVAAYIAETFAMQLYHLRQMRQAQSFASDLVNDLDYYLRDGVKVSGYNGSLHANFARNFGQRYPGCSIDDFKRTILVPRDLGPQFYFAMDFSQAMLGYDSGWAGSRENGFRKEMETANLNLSLVEAEVALFHAWEYLLLELSVTLLPQNGTVAMQMLQVAEECLKSNQRAQPPAEIFVRLSHSRANLALTLLQRLAESSHLPKDISVLLTVLLGTLNGVNDPFSKEQISYFRTLLKILFVILRGSRHSANSAAQPQQRANDQGQVAVTQIVLTILDRVVGQSFRTLAALVHEPDAVATPEDLALVTAVLQACLSVPGIDGCQVQILNIMASHDVLQLATSLFSWADKLADRGDPIYGELALLFLLELSALPTIAEQLACEGLLGHLTSANLAGFMRRANVSPFADNAGAARCYGIWAKGILPMLLNILGALGPTIAPEVAFVLNQFPNLLKSSVERFEAPGMSRTASFSPSSSIQSPKEFVTLIAISEIHSLALLTRVLAALRVNNARDIPEVQWDAGSVLENVEFWLGSRKVLRERLLPLGPRETEWRAMKPLSSVGGSENRLEEKAVGQLEAVRDVLSEE